jgi:hypothetical protein
MDGLIFTKYGISIKTTIMIELSMKQFEKNQYKSAATNNLF